jgi:hypothetical protein
MVGLAGLRLPLFFNSEGLKRLDEIVPTEPESLSAANQPQDTPFKNHSLLVQNSV